MTASAAGGAIVCAGLLARKVVHKDVVDLFHKGVELLLSLVELDKYGVSYDNVVKLLDPSL